ncbi:patatin-like phospholipase family protein [Pseudomaricurvus alkylphenolicus]|uniref:patatin-like phospholipase family protein n=1 Tax=Pseudomaricurvus alkylphenolicus TaxID=1306991 RepID=UPI001422B2B0|nr:patatin-like phospholipase family protein [Pseudomaricurvus alkylphenolicus]NIB43143.1 patatin-like phospholipase family protein [Pseudomaricurvus alkylphenolicus]
MTAKQPPAQKVVPIFSGGGTRLPAHIGILRAMEELELGFDHLVGVSGGSIVSSLHSAGYSLNHIKKLAFDTDFNQFRGFSLIRLLKDGGLSSGNEFEQWLDDRLEGRQFKDLGINFHVLATDVNGGGPVVFNREHTPDMKVSQAVRFSMSIPLLFSFKSFQDHVMVDGAILSEDALFRDWAGDQTPVLCFRLRSEQTVNRQFKKPLFPLRIYLNMLIRTFMNAISREYVHADHWHNTIIINTGKASAVDFKMSLDQKEALYQQGYKTAIEFIPRKIQLNQYDNAEAGQ